MKAKGIIKKSCLTLMLVMAMLFAMSIAVSAETMAVTGLKQTDATASSVTVSWNPVASGYLVYVNGEFKGEQTATSYSVSGMKAGQYAQVVVIGYNDTVEADAATIYHWASSGEYGYDSIYVNALTTPGKPGNVADENYTDTFDWNPKSSNQVRVGWSINKNDKYYAAGWQLEIRTVDGKKKLKTINVSGVEKSVVNTSFSIKAVKNKGFSAKVRGYININGKKKYGTWSASKVVIPQAATRITMNAKKKSATIKWDKIANATSYEVYVCKDTTVSNPKYKKVKTLKKNQTSYTLSNMVVYRRYGVKIKAVVKYGKKTYRSAAQYSDELYLYYK